jgi:hypothetical protein
MEHFSTTALVRFLGCLALAGLVFLTIGLWPRRRGSERRCRKCGYVVDNISSENCPECGSLLSGKGTVVGQRKRRAWVWGPGVLLLLAALGLGGREMYRRVNWYQYKPTRWVMRDLEARDGVREERAWWQLMRRQREGKLSKYWEEKLADVAMTHHWQWANLPEAQRRGRIVRRRGEQSIFFLWKQYESGKLTWAQVERFFKEVAITEWKVRPVVLVGQEIPYRVDGMRYVPSDWWMRFGLVGETGTDFTSGDVTGSDLGRSWIVKGSEKKTAGEQEVEIRYFTEYHRGKYPGYETAKTAKPTWRGEFNHRAKVKVLENRGDEFLKVVDAPELAEQIRASLIVEKFGYYPPRPHFDLHFTAKTPPINLAFEVLGRVDGKEYRIMDVTFRKGSGGGWLHTMVGPGWFVEQLKPKKIDLIFRSKPEVAEMTVDFMEVWKGEVVIEGVEVKNPK